MIRNENMSLCFINILKCVQDNNLNHDKLQILNMHNYKLTDIKSDTRAISNQSQSRIFLLQ